MADNGRGLPLARCKSAAYPYPLPQSLRRCWAWQSPIPGTFDLTRVAHHEAGHIAVMEWIGMDGLSATATPSSGRANFSTDLHNLPDPSPDASGELAATAGAIFHAGMMAELIHAGIKWTGPVFYPKQLDYSRADDMLRERFGRHSSAGHAFAQRVALHVLAGRWARVQEVAAVLVERGEWTG